MTERIEKMFVLGQTTNSIKDFVFTSVLFKPEFFADIFKMPKTNEQGWRTQETLFSSINKTKIWIMCQVHEKSVEKKGLPYKPLVDDMVKFVFYVKGRDIMETGQLDIGIPEIVEKDLRIEEISHIIIRGGFLQIKITVKRTDTENEFLFEFVK